MHARTKHKQPIAMYQVEITSDDIMYIKACILECKTRFDAQSERSIKDNERAVNFSLVAANVVTRLNEARMDTRDVMFINTCIEKVRSLMGNEARISREEREQIRAQGELIQNKLAGLGKERMNA